MFEPKMAVEQNKYGSNSVDINILPPCMHACRFISPSRKHRFAVMEAAISMVATLLPAIEPVDFVTIMPSVKSPIGRTVLKVGKGKVGGGGGREGGEGGGEEGGRRGGGGATSSPSCPR